jgi:hypothetical protein
MMRGMPMSKKIRLKMPHDAQKGKKKLRTKKIYGIKDENC